MWTFVHCIQPFLARAVIKSAVITDNHLTAECIKYAQHLKSSNHEMYFYKAGAVGGHIRVQQSRGEGTAD